MIEGNMAFIQKSRYNHRCRGQTRALPGSVDRVRPSLDLSLILLVSLSGIRACCSTEHLENTEEAGIKVS